MAVGRARENRARKGGGRLKSQAQGSSPNMFSRGSLSCFAGPSRSDGRGIFMTQFNRVRVVLEGFTMDATRARRTRNQARQVWYASQRQRRFARFLGFLPESSESSRAPKRSARPAGQCPVGRA